jgi:hypothetical protein
VAIHDKPPGAVLTYSIRAQAFEFDWRAGQLTFSVIGLRR